jgi:DNA polymerase III delta prime subunit
LAVNYLYGWLGKQPAPALSQLTDYLWRYRYWSLSALLAFAIASVFAERQFRKYEARAPRPLRTQGGPIRTLRSRFKLAARPRAADGQVQPAAQKMVGRATELAQLNHWLEQTRSGTRRVIFVSGEPGIGKTTLTRAFADSLASDRAFRIGRGQCVDQYGAGEPYLPILEALTRLCREPRGETLVEILHRIAPAWLAQMPSLVNAEDRARMQQLAQGMTQQRMLHEMAEALEVIAAETPLVLYLEDLHWSDPSTLDLIATVARRSEPARLMILGTYRPVDMLAGKHPLRAMKEELELHGHAIELRLPLLSEADVAAFLAERLSNAKEKIAAAVYARTEGNPLFMVNVIEYLVDQGSLAKAEKIEAPRNIRQMIERNIQRLSPDEQRILEAASVAGAEFSAAAIAAALRQPAIEIETCFTALARREQFVATQGIKTWPDGTLAANIRFHHSLYREALYNRVPPSHRVELHERIAARTEQAYGNRTAEIAAELANHYRQANRPDKAVRFFELAAERTAERRAYRETEQHYRDALAMLLTQPESFERNDQELRLQLALGGVLALTRGWSAVDADEVYTRSLALAEVIADEASLVKLRRYTFGLAVTRSELRRALPLSDQVMQDASRINSPGALLFAHYALGLTRLCGGDLVESRHQFQKALEYQQIEDGHGRYVDWGVGARTWSGVNEWLLGCPDRAQRLVQGARALAHRIRKPFNEASAEIDGSVVHLLTGDFTLVRDACDEGLQSANSFGIQAASSLGKIYAGFAKAHLNETNDGTVLIRTGIDELESLSYRMFRGFHLTLLADAQSIKGDLSDALVTVEQAIETNPDELWSRPLTLTLRGQLHLREDPNHIDLSERDFREAIELSRKISAKSPELRATTSLARMLRDTSRRDDARTMLAEVYNWFTEGFDTADLKDAKALLDELNLRIQRK